MPHMVISYAKPLETQVDIAEIVKTVWHCAEKTGLFDASAIKARALPVEHFLNANTERPFVHVDAKLFEGRTTEQKQELTKSIFEGLEAILPEGTSISVEAVDMDKASYIKN